MCSFVPRPFGGFLQSPETVSVGRDLPRQGPCGHCSAVKPGTTYFGWPPQAFAGALRYSPAQAFPHISVELFVHCTLIHIGTSGTRPTFVEQPLARGLVMPLLTWSLAICGPGSLTPSSKLSKLMRSLIHFQQIRARVSTTPKSRRACCRSLSSGLVGWDDLCIALSADCGSTLIKKVHKVTGELLDQCLAHAMTPNLSAGQDGALVLASRQWCPSAASSTLWTFGSATALHCWRVPHALCALGSTIHPPWWGTSSQWRPSLRNQTTLRCCACGFYTAPQVALCQQAV